MIRLISIALLLVPLALDSALADEPGRAAQADADRVAELVAAMRSSMPEDRAKAALAAVELQHESLLSPLLRLLSDRELGVREAAMRALATREPKSARKRAAAALNPRIARFARRESDRYELTVVIEALQELAQPSSVKPLLDGIRWDDDAEVAKARILAVGYIPHAEAVERLIQFLDKGRKGARAQRDLAHRALQFLTGVRQKRHPDHWRSWWRENEKTIDLEAVKAAREAAAAEKAAKEAARKARQEEQRKKKEERRRKKKDPEPAGGTGDDSD